MTLWSQLLEEGEWDAQESLFRSWGRMTSRGVFPKLVNVSSKNMALQASVWITSHYQLHFVHHEDHEGHEGFGYMCEPKLRALRSTGKGNHRAVAPHRS
jgi:hypothetical protein